MCDAASWNATRAPYHHLATCAHLNWNAYRTYFGLVCVGKHLIDCDYSKGNEREKRYDRTERERKQRLIEKKDKKAMKILGVP